MMPRRQTRRRLVTALALLAPLAAFAADIPAAQRRSGYEFMGRETRAIEDDDTGNPGMLAVLEGEVLWNRREGPAGKSCASCHGDLRRNMNGVAARYPAVDPVLGRPVDLEQRINLCRTERQQTAPLPFESTELLALSPAEIDALLQIDRSAKHGIDRGIARCNAVHALAASP